MLFNKNFLSLPDIPFFIIFSYVNTEMGAIIIVGLFLECWRTVSILCEDKQENQPSKQTIFWQHEK